MSRSGGAVRSAACAACAAGLDHCHAAWVRHADGWGECLVAACHLGADAHALVVRCTEVDVACCR